MQKAQLSAPRVAGLLVIVLAAILAVHWVIGLGAIARLVPGSLSIGLVNPLLFLAIGVCFFGCTQPPGAAAHTAWVWALRVCIVALIGLPLSHLLEGAAGVSLGLDFPRADARPSPLNPHPGRLSPNTGLLNRSGFEAWLEQQGSTRSLALLYIDLDRFKQVNDTHGHAVGDQLLQQFARRLQALVRPTDAVARLGGDEFAVALAGMRDVAHADAVAEKVVAAAQPRFEIAELQLEIGASVGVALGTDGAESWRGLIARADRMLYQAKEGGRGRHASGAQRSRR
ncbi:hypothetical protein GCM10023165_15030 [Variovorax defluvii]|uniref:GGDEF domain-containing protein n=1 Tax=Variovorax defluvii TaxID=913761 RepID=A0ABP8HBR0_9BURK